MATTKKTTKVPAPVDARETFVSLQKNFAETEQSAQEKLKLLFELQAADNDIDKLVQFRGELPEEVTALEAEVESLNAKYARVEQLIEGYNQNIASSKAQIEELDAETQKYRDQLEHISNSREFDSINKEIENQDLLKKIAEKNIDEARESIEDRKADLERIKERIAVREADLESKKAELDSIVESTSKEEAALEKKRTEFSSKLDERTLSAYERIRKSTHNHLAVVTLFPKNDDGTYGNACGGCFHTITPQRLIDIASGKKLVICEHCGRIIVSPDI